MHQPLSHIHPNAKIAHNVIIEPFVTIHDNVEIGKDTWIGPNVSIMEGARIGNGCKIFPGSVISAVPQDLKFNGEKSLTIIGDNVTIREYCTINRGTVDKYQTVIKDNALIMAYVHLAHDCLVGRNSILANAVNLAGHVEIGNNVVVGGLSAIHQFVTIGDYVMISGGSLVRKDIPPYTKAAREPLSYAGINSIGLRRRDFSDKKINEIQDIYRILFVRGYNITQALTYIEAEFSITKERDEILNFIRKSDRGVMKGYVNKK